MGAWAILRGCWLLVPGAVVGAVPGASSGAAASRPRVVVSTDIGGTDPDDFQSMVHFLVYADRFEVEGLVSSPYGPGRKEHILEVIARYERDFPKLRTHAPGYPAPEALRAVTKQGAIASSGAAGVGRATEGSDWIVRCARRADTRPLWVLVWGGIDDLAQALHDAPDILPQLRVYFIGGPNKMWSVDAYHYLEQQHPNLWLIEANSTYRGWFVGGQQVGEWSNAGFVAAHVAGRGALGDYFATHLRGAIKMGDTPAVVYLLHRAPEDPTQGGWGGRFVPVWAGRRTLFERLTTAEDEAEAFGVVEFSLPHPAGLKRGHATRMLFDNRIPAEAIDDGVTLRFRFSPRDAKVWAYTLQSDAPELAGMAGAFTAVKPTSGKTQRREARQPQWWTDDPAPEAAEGVHAGAKHVSRWREEFLRDFAARMLRCREARP